MSENQKQNIIDITNISNVLTLKETETLKKFAEKLLDIKLLMLVPDAILENMDTTEKLMLINYYSKSEEERQKDEKEAIPLEECLKKAGLSINDLQDRNWKKATKIYSQTR